MSTIFSDLGLHRKHFYTGENLLTYAEVKTVIGYLLKTEKAVILGGDVLNLASEYTYNNWYYDPTEDTSWSEQVILSCEHTLRYIEQATQTDKNLYCTGVKHR